MNHIAKGVSKRIGIIRPPNPPTAPPSSPNPPSPLPESPLRTRLIDFISSYQGDFAETSDTIWRMFSESIADFDKQAATFIEQHWDKFSMLRTEATWESLKEDLGEAMERQSSKNGQPIISWDQFRIKFIQQVQTLVNQALTEMQRPEIQGHALGTKGWRSDIDWEIFPAEKPLSHTDLMLAKLLFDTFSSHFLGLEAQELRGCYSGEALDIEFYTEHHAKQLDTFSILTLPETKSEFYIQELTVGTLQNIRAYGSDLSSWKAWTTNILIQLKDTPLIQAKFQNIFDHVERFEEELEKETLGQIYFEINITASGILEPDRRAEKAASLKAEIQNLSLTELREKTIIVGGKEGVRYKLALRSIAVKRLLSISQMIDKDSQKAQELLDQINHLALTEFHIPESRKRIETKQKEYELKCLDIAFKLTLRTSFFDEAVYTQSEYTSTVLDVRKGQLAQRISEQHLMQRKGSVAGLRHISKRRSPDLIEERRSNFCPPLITAAALENSAQQRHSIYKMLKRKTTSFLKENPSQSAIIESAKYALRKVEKFQRLQEIGIVPEKMYSSIQILSFKAQELEKCKRKKVLSHTGFQVLLQEALEELKIKNAEQTAQDATALFEKGGMLYDEEAEFKLSEQEKYKPLTAFLRSKIVPNNLNAKTKLILRAKIGDVDHERAEVKQLFDRAELITLKKLQLDSPKAIENYLKALDRTFISILKEAFKNEDFASSREPNLVEIWQSAQQQ